MAVGNTRAAGTAMAGGGGANKKERRRTKKKSEGVAVKVRRNEGLLCISTNWFLDILTDLNL